MNFDFELILFYATVITGVIALFDLLFLAKELAQKTRNKNACHHLIMLILFSSAANCFLAACVFI